MAQEAATLAHGSPASVGMDAGPLDEAVQLYRDAVARAELKGAVLMVARRGVIVMQEAVGWRHEAYQLPMERDTIFRDGVEHQAGGRRRQRGHQCGAARVDASVGAGC